jgi:hypothetical protein
MLTKIEIEIKHGGTVHKGLQHGYEAGLWTTKGVQSQLHEKLCF